MKLFLLELLRVFLLALTGAFIGFFTAECALASSYDDLVLGDQPVLYLPLGPSGPGASEEDLSPGHHVGKILPSGHHSHLATLPNADRALILDGVNYVEVPSDLGLSIPTTGVLTIETWLRPDTLQFSRAESDGYVYWAGKGETNEYEYAGRMYSLTNGAGRPNRISGYAFNLSGGLGSGSYFQDPLQAGEWLHVAIVFNMRDTSPQMPSGYVRIYKNGVLRKTTALDQFNVNPGSGAAPLRIGTRDLHSFFEGAMAKFAVYSSELDATTLQAHVREMLVKAQL